MAHDKFKSCAGCPDRTIEPVNCHMDCEGYLFRQKEKATLNKKKADDKEFYNFKKIIVRETKAKVNR